MPLQAGGAGRGPRFALVGRDYETSALYVTTFEPTPEGWDEGDRGILCVISTENAATPLTATVRNSRR